MNVKTTFFLAGALIVLVVSFWLIQPEPKDITKTASTSSEPADTNQPLFEKKLDEVVKMKLVRPGKTLLTFEKPKKDDKPDEYDSWRVVEPVPGKAVTWEVNSLADKVNGLEYVKKYDKGNEQIEDSLTGLDKPRAEITVEGKDGTSRTVLVGKGLIIGDDTYLRIQGEPATYIVNADFKDNLKKKLKDFRDRDMVDFATGDVVRVEIRHEGAQYILAKTEDNWTFESPFRADADKSKITSLLSSVNSLRADEWVDAGDVKGGNFGFDKPVLTVSVTTEKKVAKPSAETKPAEPKGEEDDKKEAEPKEDIVRDSFKVEFGWWADIDKKEKLYGRVAGQPAVAVVQKLNYEKLIPKPTEWRDLAVTKADLLKASKVELKYPNQTVTVIKKDVRWLFEDDTKAESGAVDELLRKLKGLKATKFVDKVSDAGQYGLSPAQVEIRLTVEGKTDPEHILVGGKSSSGLMGYVRRGQDGPVAVVKSADLDVLAKPAAAFRDRDIFNIMRSRVKKLELSRPEPATGKKQSFTLSKTGGQWSLLEPAGDLDDDGLDDLLSDVCRLRAKTAVGTGDAAAYGLDKPAVKLVLHEEIPPPPKPKPMSQPTTTQAATTQAATTQAAATQAATTQAATTQAASQSASTQAASQPAKEEPTIKRNVLLAAKKDDKAYAKIEGSDLIFQIDTRVYDHLLGELFSREFWKIEQSLVVSTSVSTEGQPLSFEKKDDAWVNVEDPDVPVDGTKVDAHVKEIAGLQAERYVEYAAGNPAEYGLDKPDMIVKVTLDDGTVKSLHVSAKSPEKPFAETKFAALDGDKKVFLISNESIEKLRKKLVDFEKSASQTPSRSTSGFPTTPGFPGGGLR